MNMKHKLLYFFILLYVPFSVFAENASNVRVRQSKKDIIITYDLSKTSNVRLYIATEKSPEFIPLFKVEGAVGEHVKAGTNLTITWHPLEERGSLIANNVRFKVEALGSYEQYLLPKSRKGKALGGKTNMETFITADFAYGFAPQLSGGLMLGQTYSGIGWFVNTRSNFHFQSATNGLVCGEGGYIDDVLPFYSGKKQSSLFVVNAGIVMDFIEFAGASESNRFNTFGMYLGAGYGWRRSLWETVDGQWVEYGPTSNSGFSGNIGVIGSIYGLTLKAGVNTINFKYLEIEAGIGWMF